MQLHDTHNKPHVKYTTRLPVFNQSFYNLCANKLYNPPFHNSVEISNTKRR